jgi:hypothetical protein
MNMNDKCQSEKEKETEFNLIKCKLQEKISMMYSAYKMYENYKEETAKLRQKLYDLCEHNWELDHTTYDDRSNYTCTKCGK